MNAPSVKSIYFPVIAYGGSCRAEFAMSCSSLFVHTVQNRPELSIRSTGIFFESLISRARNAAAAAALHYGVDYLLFIDADIAFDAADVMKLIDHDKDIVCGPYAKKYLNSQKLNYLAQKNHNLFQSGEWKLLCSDFSSEINPSLNQENLVPVNYAATGFMLIKTAVLKAMAQHYPNIKYRNDIDGYMDFGDNFYDFFPAKVNPKSLKYESEDYGFCNMWSEMGGNIFLDKSIKLHHIGNQTYEGDLEKQLNFFK